MFRRLPKLIFASDMTSSKRVLLTGRSGEGIDFMTKIN